jgi:hypothetical protein
MSNNSNYLARIEERRRPFDALVTQEAVKRFERERVQVLAAIALSSPVTMDNHAQIAIYAFNNLYEWNEMLRISWRVTSDYFATVTDNALREKYEKSTGPLEDKARRARLLETWTDAVDVYIGNIAGSKVKNITDTTLNDIRTTVALDMAANKDTAEISQDINDLYRNDIIPYRAPIIARTEVAAASNFGNRMAAKEFEKDLLKRWVPVMDSKTREAHAMMSGSDWIPIDEPYIVGGEQLMFPGDTTWGASAWNVVNCRCGEIYKPATPKEPSYDQ